MDGRGIASAPNLILNGELWEIDSRSRACLYRTSRRVVDDGGGARVIILLFVVAPRPLMSSHDRTLNLIKSVYGVSTPFFLPTPQCTTMGLYFILLPQIGPAYTLISR